MKKNIFIVSFIVVMVLTGFFFLRSPETPSDEPQLASHPSLIEDQKVAADIQTPAPTKVDTPPLRSPAQVPTVPRKRITIEKVSPKEIEVQYQFNENYSLAKDIVAVPSKNYHPSQGPIFYKGIGFNFIRSSDSNLGQQLSIYDSKNQVLLPLSSVIKIANVDEFKRDEIISRGYKERLYLENLNLLFIETKISDYSAVFDRLKKEGFEPQFQIIDRIYEPR